jgi:hypothetical protein
MCEAPYVTGRLVFQTVSDGYDDPHRIVWRLEVRQSKTAPLARVLAEGSIAL